MLIKAMGLKDLILNPKKAFNYQFLNVYTGHFTHLLTPDVMSLKNVIHRRRSQLYYA